MTVDGDASSRVFVAHPPALGSKFSSTDQVKNVTRYLVRGPADHAVSGADWLTLVEAFGLTPYLEERG
jgi:hypothetical protein